MQQFKLAICLHR